MAKKSLTNKLFASVFGAASLLTNLPVVANPQQSASHNIIISIPEFRTVYVKDNKIMGVSQLANPGYLGIKVCREDGTEIPMTSEIQFQYYFLRKSEIASKAGINWEDNHYWYKAIDPSIFDSYQGTWTILEN